MANMKAVSRKGQSLKENCKPISILPLISRIFVRTICKQLTNFFDDMLLKYQCGFRKGLGTQHCLLLMLEKWRKVVDNEEAFVAFSTDLSNVADCFNHEILIAKLHVSLSSLNLVRDYLLNRMQRFKVNSNFSSRADILDSVQ